MKKVKSPDQLQKLYQSLAGRLANTGPILQGTITERTITGEKDKKQKPKQTYGPYYQWTFKREGKTITVNLTKEQAKLYQKAIDNQREMEKTLKEMRVLSEKILEDQTVGVKRRKTRR